MTKHSQGLLSMIHTLSSNSRTQTNIDIRIQWLTIFLCLSNITTNKTQIATNKEEGRTRTTMIPFSPLWSKLIYGPPNTTIAVTATCGGTTSVNGTYFQNSGYPPLLTGIGNETVIYHYLQSFRTRLEKLFLQKIKRFKITFILASAAVSSLLINVRTPFARWWLEQ